jgi:alpha-beta hydrolase superfamily lysophospholipase
MARLMSILLPKLGLETIDASAISQDESVVKAYVNDPLVYRGKIRARLGSELIEAMQKLTDIMAKINLPVLIMHGSADRLSNPEGSEFLYEKIGSEDKTLKVYEGFYHEIFNEPRRMEVFKDMESWLISH